MTTWTGWDEKAVRHRPLTEDAEIAAVSNDVSPHGDFTPTNVSSGDGQARNNHTSEDHNLSAYPSRMPTNMAISKYLGRASASASTAKTNTVAAVFHVSTTKKAPKKTQKRAATTASCPKSKRQKSATLTHVLPTSKPGAHDTFPGAAHKHRAVQQPSGNYDQIEQRNTNEGQLVETGVRPVYSSATSVKSMQPFTSQTSMSALQSSGGHGYVAYQRQPSVRTSNTAEFMRPLVDQAASFANGMPLGTLSVTEMVEQNCTHPPRPPPTTEPLGTMEALRPSISNPGMETSGTTSRVPAPPDQGAGISSPILVEDDEEYPSDYDDETLRLLESAEGLEQMATTSTSAFNIDLASPVGAEVREVSDIDVWKAAGAPNTMHPRDLRGPDEDLTDLSELDVESFIDITEVADQAPRTTKDKTPPPRDKNQNQREVERDDHYGGAFLSEQDVQLLDQLRLARATARKRVLRSPFPASILDRSPIYGASNNNVLRTCFRIGEAFNAGSQAVRANKSVTIELYARVVSSHREGKPGRKQHFLFQDLYHDKPPYLQGTYELWDQSRLWDLDSKTFLKQRENGIMCRLVAKMKRENNKWGLQIHNIWECDWDDVDYVAGICAA